MTPAAVTTALLHHLVAGTHAEGVTALAVACTVDHDDRALLIIPPGRDLTDTWQLPAGPVLPGDTLTDAAAKTLAVIGLHLHEITGYLGHHDRLDTDGELTRVFCFAVTVTDPDSICRTARISHRWADLDDLPDLSAPPARHPATLASDASTSPRVIREPDDPPLAKPLRTGVRGLWPAAQAGTELLIGHSTWLQRSDFRDRFAHLDNAIIGDTETAAIDWPAAITALDTGHLPCSSGEAKILRLTASLVDGIPVNLRDALTGMDNHNLDLVSQAVLHTAGR